MYSNVPPQNLNIENTNEKKKIRTYMYENETTLYFSKTTDTNIYNEIIKFEKPTSYFLSIDKTTKYNLIKFIHIFQSLEDIEVKNCIQDILKYYFEDTKNNYSKGIFTLYYKENNDGPLPKSSDNIIQDNRKKYLQTPSPNLLELNTYFDLNVGPRLKMMFTFKDKELIPQKLKLRTVWLDKPMQKQKFNTIKQN